MNQKQIEQRVLQKVTPTPKQKKKLHSITDDFIKKIKQELQKRNTPAQVQLVGSVAKDTFLPYSLDIDVFILFPANTEKDILAKEVKVLGTKLLSNTEQSYAEHPYIRGQYHGYQIELVPCYHITDPQQKHSAVDRTPFHTQYIKKHLSNEQKNEVRLFKQFLKGIGCYGAEAQIEGFSGYLCELLILRYATFHELIQQASTWTQGTTLSLHKTTSPTFETPLVFIDPVDPERNVASALSEEKFHLFIHACKEYLKTPKYNFYFPHTRRPYSLKKIKEELQDQQRIFIGISLPKPSILDENLYPQIRKALRSVKELCERYDFTIKNTYYYHDEVNKQIYLLLEPEVLTISSIRIHEGPPTDLTSHSTDFLNKWKNHPQLVEKPYRKENRWYVTLKREYTSIYHLLQEQISNVNLGKHLNELVTNNISILNKQELIRPELTPLWTEILDPKDPWEV